MLAGAVFALVVTGFAAPAVSEAATGISARTATALKQETGYSASELESRPACDTQIAGEMSCEADVLSVKSTGRPARLLHAPRATPSTVTGSVSRARESAAREVQSDSSTTGVPAPAEGTPAYLQWAYDLSWLSLNKGAGDTIGVIDAYDDPNAAADLATFRQTYGLYPCATTANAAACGAAITSNGLFGQYNQTGQAIDSSGPGTAPGTDSTGGWEVEESLDLDAISSLCPECTIDLVESDPGTCDPYPAVCQFDANLATAAQTAKTLGAKQISMSFGSNDTVAGHDDETWWYTGVTSLGAAGDEGYSEGVANKNYVSYPAAASQVTAVGGTSLNPADNARGFNETVWNDGYVSRDSSYYATQSGCDTSVSSPSYQAGITTGCSGRAYNDISADGDPDTGLLVYDSYDEGSGNGWSLVGGTSLATPLAAAYEALTAVTPADTPAWAYTHQSSLNDITSGNDVDYAGAACPSNWNLICYASLSWDGPSGNGSLGGDLSVGGPGIGGDYTASVGTTSAQLAGGVYPNGLDTTYYWQYGTTTAYGSATQVQDAGSSQSPNPMAVSTTLSNLTPGTTYHYRLVAYNSDDPAVYGYDETFTIGSPSSGDTGTTTTATGGSTGTTATSNSSGSGTTTSPSRSGLQPPTEVAAPAATSLPIVGGEITLSAGRFANAVSQTVQFYRCAHTCVLLSTGDARSYRIRAADAGHYIKLKLTVTGQPGTKPLVATDWIGPIRAPVAGAARMTSATRVGATMGVFGSSRVMLASVRVTRHSGRKLTLAITKPGSSRTQVWAYVLSGNSVISCTPAHVIRGTLKLNVAPSSGQTLKLVAVRS
jgi:hypothetical protein